MSLASGNRALTVESHDRVGALAEDWDQLAKRTGAPPFQRPGWFDAWLDAFGGGRAEILAVRRGEALTGVLPLVRRAGSLRSATNWHTPLFGPVAADAAALAALTAALLRERASRYDISFLDASGPEPAALREAARAAGAKVVERTIARQPFVDVSGDWAAYEARLERKQRKELGRVRRRLENEGELRFEFVSDDERLDALLDEGFAVEGSGWKSAGGTAIASDPAVERFYRRVAHWASGDGMLVLAFVRLDTRAIAFDMTIESADSAYVLKGGFDPEYRRFAPGSLLTYESLVRAFSSPLR